MKVRAIRYWVIIAVGLWTYSSCIDEITLDIDNDAQFVIVNGLVTDEPGAYTITVDNSPIIGVGNDNIVVPISGASVQLVDDQNSSVTFVESSEEAGTYTANVTNVVPGRSYHIEVQLPNGVMIESEPQQLPDNQVLIDNIDWNIVDVEFINESGNVVGREFVEIYANTVPTDEEAFVRWRVTGEYDIVEKADGAIIQEPILKLPMDSRFNILYLFNVSQFTISSREHEYWSRIQQLINVEGTLFDPPPGVLRGNLFNVSDPDDNIQGYFSVARQSFERRFVNIAEKGFFADTDCQSRPNANNPEKCVDCTTINRSTLVKPDYWLF